jgi:hypothetical protein
VITAVILAIWIAAAFTPDGQAKYGAFDTKETCDGAVEAARAAGLFATDCVRVELPKPKNGNVPS